MRIPHGQGMRETKRTTLYWWGEFSLDLYEHTSSRFNGGVVGGSELRDLVYKPGIQGSRCRRMQEFACNIAQIRCGLYLISQISSGKIRPRIPLRSRAVRKYNPLFGKAGPSLAFV